MSSTSDPTSRADPSDRLAHLDSVRAPDGHFDEARDAAGHPRDVWRAFAATAGDLTPKALDAASARIARQLREHGVTYNVYEPNDAAVRPWALDVLPMMITADEWQVIEAGVRQQARLLNAIAADLYRDRALLGEGLLPHALVFGHRGFLRACRGARPSGDLYIHVAALDLARGPDGRWHLMGARVQAPSGLGYALENRAAIARVFPDALRHLHIRPLAPFADQLLAALTAHAPSDDDAPRAVMLTPGPYTETYFEHLFLARQLGIPLVQGGDLTVRQDRVFLKTVTGLLPVHAIWRRVDDDFCDPLELRSDSALGVAGLLQAWRSGRVLVANGFGLGVLESPALLSHLPVLCRRLLNEDLALPVVPTRWQPTPESQTIGSRELAQPVIDPALSTSGADPVFGRLRDAEARSSWMNRLEANPQAYVLQDFVPLSHAPVWQRGALESRALMMRVFLVTDGAGDYQVMPGALTRVALGDHLSVSAQRGGASKDTWVHAPGPIDELPRAPVRRDPLHAASARRTVTSRSAEHLFWLGRYAERSENNGRLARTVLTRLTEGGVLPGPLLACMVHTCGDEGLLTAEEMAEPFAEAESVSMPEFVDALIAGVFDGKARSGLAFNVAHTTRVAGSVRERLSYDNWRVLAQLARRLAPRRPQRIELDVALEAIDDAILSLVAAGGLETAHMTRDDGWRFLSLGRHLERLSSVSSSLLGVIAQSGTDEPAVLDWILELSDSLITYRTRFRRLPDWATVIDLLLVDDHNPRALFFQVSKLAKHLRLLPGRSLDDLVRDVDALVLARPAESDADRGEPALVDATIEALLHRCQELSDRVSEALTLQYFSHVYDIQHATVNA